MMQVTTIFCDVCSEEIKDNLRYFKISCEGVDNSIYNGIIASHLHYKCLEQLIQTISAAVEFPGVQKEGIFRNGYFDPSDFLDGASLRA